MITEKRLEQLRKAQLLSIESRKRNVALKNKNERDAYELSPKKCIVCGENVPYSMVLDTRNSARFCSFSCRASFWNKKRSVPCFVCGNGCSKKHKIVHENKDVFLCNRCVRKVDASKKSLSNVALKQRNITVVNGRNVQDYERRYKLLVNGELSDENARVFFRKITLHKCSICGLSEWRGKTIPVVVDHIDGDHTNNKIENLRLVCCNCDALLPTSKSKNRDNGRTERRKRYQMGKSYSPPKIDRYCVFCGAIILGKGKKYCSSYCENKYIKSLLPPSVSKRTNKRKIEMPDKEQLEKDILEMSWSAAGRKYGVCAGTIKKWSKIYNLL